MRTKKDVEKQLDVAEATLKRILAACKSSDGSLEAQSLAVGTAEALIEIYFDSN